MGYPRQLKLDAKTEGKLKDYLDFELFNHYGEREPYINDLIKWQRDYWASPQQKKKSFPFQGASNIVIPITAISVEAIHARVMTTLFAFGDTQFVAAHAMDPDWEESAQPVERFLDWNLLHKAKIYYPLNDSILELIKLGTGVGKSGYIRIVRKAVKEVDGKEKEFEVTIKDGACIDSVSTSRFLMPFMSQDPQTAPWCGEEHSMTKHQVRIMEESGMFKPGTTEELDGYFWNLAAGPDATVREYQRSQESLENRVPVWPRLLDFCEIWLGFNVDDAEDGEEKEIVIHYHRVSRTIMSLRYNWHEDLHRPYRKGVYIPVEHRWAGLGVGKQCEQFMREITTIHRQRLDNATLANMRMIKVNRLSGYGPGEPIFPGKMWFVDDMSHIDTLQLGEIYQSSFQNEQSSLIYSQQRTGVNEVTLGMPSVGTPGTATSDLTRVQEGSRKFDFTYKNIKLFVNDLITDFACNTQQFGPRNLEYYDYVDGGKLVKDFFQMPQSLIRDNLLISVKSAGQQENKLLDRQNWTQIAQMFQQYAQGMLQLPIVQQDPEISKLVQLKIIGGATEAFKQMLETFDIRNIDRIVPYKEAERLVKDALGSIPALAGGTGSAESTIPAGGSLGTPKSIPSLGAGSPPPTI